MYLGIGIEGFYHGVDQGFRLSGQFIPPNSRSRGERYNIYGPGLKAAIQNSIDASGTLERAGLPEVTVHAQSNCGVAVWALG